MNRYDAWLKPRNRPNEHKTKMYLPDKLGVDHSLVWRWMNGKKTCPDRRRAQILEITGMTLEQLMEDAG